MHFAIGLPQLLQTPLPPALPPLTGAFFANGLPFTVCFPMWSPFLVLSGRCYALGDFGGEYAVFYVQFTNRQEQIISCYDGPIHRGLLPVGRYLRIMCRNSDERRVGRDAVELFLEPC